MITYLQFQFSPASVLLPNLHIHVPYSCSVSGLLWCNGLY